MCPDPKFRDGVAREVMSMANFNGSIGRNQTLMASIYLTLLPTRIPYIKYPFHQSLHYFYEDSGAVESDFPRV